MLSCLRNFYPTLGQISSQGCFRSSVPYDSEKLSLEAALHLKMAVHFFPFLIIRHVDFSEVEKI